MFISLNKKFLLTIFAFFLLSAGIFIVLFDSTIGKKISQDRGVLLSKNQYVIELLNENITLRKKLNKLTPEQILQTPQHLSQMQEALTKERQLNEELTKNYNENYETFKETLKILSLSALLMFLSLIILWVLLKHWIISPIEKLTALSNDVASGNFTTRINTKKHKFTDEFETLINTVNLMVSNIDEKISEIKQQELFLQSLIDAVPDAIRVIDSKHNIILQNKAYRENIDKHYLQKATKCYKSYNLDATCPCNSSQYLCPLEKLKQNQEGTLRFIHSVNNRPLFINSARIILNGEYCIVESIRDLSDNVNYSHQQKITSLGLLATSIAHEMKNNLGAINIILDGLLQKYHNTAPKNEEEKYLDMISKQIKECIKVPERLLKLSRNTGDSSTNFNITSAILDTLSLLDYEIKSKGINLIENFSNKNETITGNETDFKMIILNLVQNAIKAMPNGGTLNIKTNTSKTNTIITVTDNGCGINEEDINHIFEPFYSTAGDNQKGTGLGLAIVKNLVSNLNATISVTSTTDVGSSFKIEIPRNKQKKLL